MCSAGRFLKVSEKFDPFLHSQASWLELQNYLAPGNLSNLSFLVGAEQLVCRTPPLADSVPTMSKNLLD